MNGSVDVSGTGDDRDGGRDVDVYSVRSVAEIRGTLAQLARREAKVTAQLDALILSQRDLQRDLGRLDLFRTNLNTHAAKTRAISNGMLADAASTASRISAAVKQLDLEQSRVKDTLTVVEQVRELKACVLGVAGSMGGPQDWETAAAYLARASKIPKEVIEGAFAARVVPTEEVPDAPQITLNNASEALSGLFQREFEKAVKEGDGAKVTKFFKLFPLINRSEVGLDLYGRYVCQGIAARARTNLNTSSGSRESYFYATALSKLFEHIAQIIDSHGPLVERHYGPGKMVRVIERLQAEADLQGGIILDTWSDERRIDKHLTEVKSYAYTFLVQSFLPPARSHAGTSRSGSPAPDRHSEDGDLDMKEIDALLNEMTNMLAQWSLYTRFVSEKCSPSESSLPTYPPAFLVKSGLATKIDDRLLTPFNTMTTFFFRRSVEKAFQLDEQPSDLSLQPQKPIHSTPPHVSSAIEDIMYIINKIVQQSLATSQIAVIQSVIPTLARVMSSDFLGMEQRKMRDEHFPRPVVQGGLPPEHTIVSFIVLINNIDVAKDFVTQIVNTRLDATIQPSIYDLFPLEAEAKMATTTLRSFSTTFRDKTAELLHESVTVVFSNVIKPRLRPILAETFRDIEYSLSHDDLLVLANDLGHDDLAAYQDEVRRRFSLGWDALTRPIKRLMTESTWDNIFAITTNHLSKLLEKRLWTYTGRVNQAGASRLEHDINAIVKVVTTGQKYKAREAFVRCLQICMILSMDREEWEEIERSEGGGGEIADKLKMEERRRVRLMLADG